MNFPEDYINKIICGHSLEIMKGMPDKCIDLVVTSPPYNLNIVKTLKEDVEKWKGKWKQSKLQLEGYDNHSDYMPEDQYIKWQQDTLKEAFRLLKDDGAIFYNHKWRVQKKLYQQRLEILDGLPLRQIIIWKKSGGINFNPGYFLPTYEVIYLIAKPDFKLAPKVNRYGDVWSIHQEHGKHSWHPAVFPVELASRCVEATTGSLILDPFVGSGTVPIACKKHNKNYIGIDISENYCKNAEDRIKNHVF
jgi:modification methylase